MLLQSKGKSAAFTLAGENPRENVSRGRLYFRPILRSDVRSNDSRRRHQFWLHLHDKKSPFARRRASVFFFSFLIFFDGGFIGETTEWTISGGLYGSLRRKRSSHPGKRREGFCQCATEVAENKRCRCWWGGNCRSCERTNTCIIDWRALRWKVLLRRERETKAKYATNEWFCAPHEFACF